MTHDPRLDLLRFYLTAPAPCPYLPERMERKIFTPLVGRLAPDLNDALTLMGFRRSQNIAYKPACEACSACVSVRIPVASFAPNRKQRRVMRMAAGLERLMMRPEVTAEQYAILESYLLDRHPDGGMADMTPGDFATMVEETSVNTVVVEYRRARDDGHALVSFSLTDILADGLSMVYSAFLPSEAGRSPGWHMILDHIALARRMGLPHVYLGYWIAGCRKMEYKRQFKGLEALTAKGWVPLDAAED